MPNYANGKIYKIACKSTGLIYIGSTTNAYLCNRLGQHTHRFRNQHLTQYTSSQIIANGNYFIELIELVPCSDKDELTKRERYWIDNLECVNKQLPTRTKKEYRAFNKDKQQAYMKTYYINNRQAFIDKEKKRRQESNVSL